MKMLLRRMLDPAEFLSPHGVRALSKVHEGKPYVLEVGGARFSIGYEPGEGTSHAFGGNSNWRGPVWMPVNILLVDSLREFYRYYGDDFLVECPVGSGQSASLKQVADQLAERLKALFLRGADGRRPFLGDDALSQTDPEFRDHLLFHEYFHGDTGTRPGRVAPDRLDRLHRAAARRAGQRLGQDHGASSGSNNRRKRVQGGGDLAGAPLPLVEPPRLRAICRHRCRADCTRSGAPCWGG